MRIRFGLGSARALRRTTRVTVRATDRAGAPGASTSRRTIEESVSPGRTTYVTSREEGASVTGCVADGPSPEEPGAGAVAGAPGMVGVAGVPGVAGVQGVAGVSRPASCTAPG
jgi:hypothetical protein